MPIFAAVRAAAEKRLENSAAAPEYFAKNVERIVKTAAAKSAALRESAMAESRLSSSMSTS